MYSISQNIEEQKRNTIVFCAGFGDAKGRGKNKFRMSDVATLAPSLGDEGVSHRKGFGNLGRCVVAKGQAVPASDPLTGAGRLAL